MKSSPKIKLFFMFFMMCSFCTHAFSHEQVEEKLLQEENREFENIKERIFAKIKEILFQCKIFYRPQAPVVVSKEELICEDVPDMLEKIRKDFGLSGVVAYECSLDRFWRDFRKKEPDAEGGVEPKNVHRVIKALSFGVGLDASLSFLLNGEVSVTGNNASIKDHLDAQLNILFSPFEDTWSDPFKTIIRTRIQKEENLLLHDVSKILRDTFSSFFVADLMRRRNFLEPNITKEAEEIFPEYLDRSVQKIKNNKILQVISNVSRDYSKVLAIVDRYKENNKFCFEFSIYDHCILSKIKNSLIDLQRFFGDSSLVVFKLIERRNSGGASFQLDESLFEICLDETTTVLQKRSKNNEFSLYNFGWDLSCLFTSNLDGSIPIERESFEENFFYLGSLIEILTQLKKEEFSEEQLRKILKYLLENDTKEQDRIRFFEKIYEDFLNIKARHNLENKKNSLDILRKSVAEFPELCQEKNKKIMNGLLGILPDKSAEDLSDQERENYEQKLFGIFRVADWNVCAEKNCSITNFTEKVLKILESDNQVRRKKEQKNESECGRKKILAFFPEKDSLFVDLVNRIINENEISEEDAFGIIQMKERGSKEQILREQKKVEEKMFSTFLRKNFNDKK
ncbi:hypothetical protein HE1_00940 [Holospora elegans E1]|uniref:Uncharacterized protein n=1 Tax=Holospora elegans E1 TaxID=1427503 RepID=A0A023DZU9_9PROT|nr:hypothetical protein [Holospora elegans]GAJ46605.1 hypothetical protein HE1_00940 [Holospora elegans E1]